jgi:hypothetical protein
MSGRKPVARRLSTTVQHLVSASPPPRGIVASAPDVRITMDEVLRLLELWEGLTDERRSQVLWLAETLVEWQARYGD